MSAGAQFDWQQFDAKPVVKPTSPVKPGFDWQQFGAKPVTPEKPPIKEPGTLPGPPTTGVLLRELALGAGAGAGLPETTHASDFSVLPGLLRMATHPVDSAKLLAEGIVTPMATELAQAKNLWEEGGARNRVEAVARGFAGSVPILGPAAFESGTEVGEGIKEGDLPKVFHGAGGVLGTLGTLGLGTRGGQKFVEKVVPPVARAAQAAVKLPFTAAERLLEIRRAGKVTRSHQTLAQAVPPTKSTPYELADVAAARPHLEAEHTTNPIKTVEGLRDAADSAITKVEEQVSAAIAANPTDQITTQPLRAAQAKLGTHARGDAFTQAGLRELADFNLHEPKTLAEADLIRKQLNAENKAVLKKNNYDVATARAVDPGFAAREAAVESLRDGVYGKLEERGVAGVRDLRRTEGSLIKVRNAAQNQMFNADKVVAATAKKGPGRQIVKGLVKGASTATGAALAGPAGAIVGQGAGEALGRAVTRKGLTRNQLVEQAFKDTVAAPAQPLTVPAAPAPRGLLTPGATPLRGAPPAASGPVVPPTPVRVEPGTRATRLGLLLPPKGGTSEVPVLAPPVREQAPPRMVPARKTTGRDPKTGKFKLVYTTEPEGGQPRIVQRGQPRMTPEQQANLERKVYTAGDATIEKEGILTRGQLPEKPAEKPATIRKAYPSEHSMEGGQLITPSGKLVFGRDPTDLHYRAAKKLGFDTLREALKAGNIRESGSNGSVEEPGEMNLHFSSRPTDAQRQAIVQLAKEDYYPAEIHVDLESPAKKFVSKTVMTLPELWRVVDEFYKPPEKLPENFKKLPENFKKLKTTKGKLFNFPSNKK